MGADDLLSGGAGNDTLIGGAGADTMVGGVGDDTYWVSSAAQTVSEQPNQGSDTLVTSVAFILPTNIETLVLWQSGTIAFGNADNNVIFGNALLASRLDGDAGNDIIVGGNGADTIIGNSGDDVLGGYGGADLFQFEQVDFGNDIVTGFSGAATVTRSIFAAGVSTALPMCRWPRPPTVNSSQRVRIRSCLMASLLPAQATSCFDGLPMRLRFGYR